MTIYRHDIEDTNGDLVDVEYYCSAVCWEIAASDNPEMGEAYGHACPNAERADYAQHCPQCGIRTVEPNDYLPRCADGHCYEPALEGANHCALHRGFVKSDPIPGSLGYGS